jgi:uncharacterized membrane protein YbhN (UPF0104 family)
VTPSLWRIAKWVAGGGLILGIVWLNRKELLDALSQSFDWSLLGIAGLLWLAGVVLTFFRWFLLVRAQELPFRQVDAVRLGFVSYLFSIVLPGSIGGDLVKAGFLAREQRRRTIAIATIIIDRVIGLYGLILLATLVGLCFWDSIWSIPQLRWMLVFVWGVAGGVMLGVAFVPFLPLGADPIIHRLRRMSHGGMILGEFVRAAQMYRHKASVLAMATALAVIGHFGFVLSFYFCALAVPGNTPSLEAHYLIIPIGMVVQSVPLTPGNIGVSEGVFNELYRLVDPSLEVKGMLVSLAQRLVTWCVAIIGFVFYLPLRRTVRQVIDETPIQPPDGRVPAAHAPVRVRT